MRDDEHTSECATERDCGPTCPRCDGHGVVHTSTGSRECGKCGACGYLLAECDCANLKYDHERDLRKDAR